MRNSFFSAGVLLLSSALSFSCSSYKQNIMFKTGSSPEIQQQVKAAEKNYVIQKNDLLSLSVYTNEGERIIDPDFQLSKDLGGQQGGEQNALTYLITEDGKAKFPMVGEVMVEGLSLRQAEELLQKEYARYYQRPFVSLTFNNKRAIVLGATGGQVIPLTNENVRLVEVIALAGGVVNEAKAHNIRVLRGNDVYVADLSTISGYRQHNMIIEPGDVIYIEPVRRPLVEGMRDYMPFITVLSSISTLIIVLISL